MENISPNMSAEQLKQKYSHVIDEVANIDKMKITSRIKLTEDVIEIIKYCKERLKTQ